MMHRLSSRMTTTVLPTALSRAGGDKFAFARNFHVGLTSYRPMDETFKSKDSARVPKQKPSPRRSSREVSLAQLLPPLVL